LILQTIIREIRKIRQIPVLTIKQIPPRFVIINMTKPANSTDKPSPSDTPTHRPHDNGGKSKVRRSDREYSADQPHSGDIAKKYETEEQPVHSADKNSR
jgi:hypothetical protein